MSYGKRLLTYKVDLISVLIIIDGIKSYWHKTKGFFLSLEIFIYLELTNQDPRFQLYTEPTTYSLNLGLTFLKNISRYYNPTEKSYDGTAQECYDVTNVYQPYIVITYLV